MGVDMQFVAESRRDSDTQLTPRCLKVPWTSHAERHAVVSMDRRDGPGLHSMETQLKPDAIHQAITPRSPQYKQPDTSFLYESF
jgi:hypothetical protein